MRRRSRNGRIRWWRLLVFADDAAWLQAIELKLEKHRQILAKVRAIQKEGGTAL